MSKVTVRDIQKIGEVTATLEYEFSTIEDFFKYEDRKVQNIKDAISSIYGESEQSAVVDINVKKKETKH
jgi:hypothetical protein